jgi:hypothetical protein
MSLSSYLDSLADKHAELEKALHAAYVNHDYDLIRDLKRRKLRIKDEISNMTKKRKKDEAA